MSSPSTALAAFVSALIFFTTSPQSDSKQLRSFGPPSAARYLPSSDSSPEPRIARDEVYAAAILRAWVEDADIATAISRGDHLVHEPLSYEDGSGTLYGEFFSTAAGAVPRPGIVMFHTGAGPRDVFLHWRASSLAAAGFVVFVADMIGDSAGDRWDSAAWQAAAHHAHDPSIAARVALRQLRAHPLVNDSSIVAMGWCAGGGPVFELLRAAPPGLQAVVTGVADRQTRFVNSFPLSPIYFLLQ